MPGRRKIDRVAARLLFEAGATFAQIAERQGVTPQAVHKMATKEGWQRGEGDGGLLATTATAERILRPVTPADHRIASEGVRTLARMQSILDHVASGATRSIAAGMAGIADDTMRAWAKEDGAFAALLREAESRKTWRRVQALETASQRGDIAATKMLLERDPSSREEWGGARDPNLGDGPFITLNLVLGQGGALVQRPGDAAQVIEHAEEARAARSLVRSAGQRPPVRMVTAPPLPTAAPEAGPISHSTEDESP